MMFEIPIDFYPVHCVRDDQDLRRPSVPPQIRISRVDTQKKFKAFSLPERRSLSPTLKRLCMPVKLTREQSQSTPSLVPTGRSALSEPVSRVSTPIPDRQRSSSIHLGLPSTFSDLNLKSLSSSIASLQLAHPLLNA